MAAWHNSNALHPLGHASELLMLTLKEEKNGTVS
ncbi:hypothetical protein C8J34_10970 [Rhizobium sp. PP-F2F-G36]|nr:hypothetical protein C8J34_10970 [Rhizobium sp. PP-F2F-G36]